MEKAEIREGIGKGLLTTLFALFAQEWHFEKRMPLAWLPANSRTFLTQTYEKFHIKGNHVPLHRAAYAAFNEITGQMEKERRSLSKDLGDKMVRASMEASVLHACTRKDRRNVPRSLRISTATRFPGPFTANSTCETATPSTFFLSPTTLGAELVSTYSATHSWPQSLHDFCHISTSPGAGATVFRALPQCGKKCLNILTDKPPAAFNLSRLAQQQPRQHE